MVSLDLGLCVSVSLPLTGCPWSTAAAFLHCQRVEPQHPAVMKAVLSPGLLYGLLKWDLKLGLRNKHPSASTLAPSQLLINNIPSQGKPFLHPIKWEWLTFGVSEGCQCIKVNGRLKDVSVAAGNYQNYPSGWQKYTWFNAVCCNALPGDVWMQMIHYGMMSHCLYFCVWVFPELFRKRKSEWVTGFVYLIWMPGITEWHCV